MWIQYLWDRFWDYSSLGYRCLKGIDRVQCSKIKEKTKQAPLFSNSPGHHKAWMRDSNWDNGRKCYHYWTKIFVNSSNLSRLCKANTCMICRVGLNNPQAYIVAYKGRGEVSSLQGSENIVITSLTCLLAPAHHVLFTITEWVWL